MENKKNALEMLGNIDVNSLSQEELNQLNSFMAKAQMVHAVKNPCDHKNKNGEAVFEVAEGTNAAVCKRCGQKFSLDYVPTEQRKNSVVTITNSINQALIRLDKRNGKELKLVSKLHQTAILLKEAANILDSVETGDGIKNKKNKGTNQNQANPFFGRGNVSSNRGSNRRSNYYV